MPDEKRPLGVESAVLGLGMEPAGDTERGEDAQPTPPPLSGPSAPRYEVRGVLGEGGMGRVEEVWDRDLLRELAVKRLRPEMQRDVRLVRQFLWEARVTAHLDHPNIVPLHDLRLDEDRHPFFTMKRVRGRPLRVVLDALREGDADTRQRLGLQRRLRLFLQLCNAVDFAHHRGVVHRDLKPDNVMLGEHGEVLVMDWGLAVPTPDDRGATLRAIVPDDLLESTAGTPLYMSPEQARGDEVLDTASDIFTLGAVLYELVSLERPYTGETPLLVMAQAASGEVRPLVEVAPEVSSSLAAVVQRAMALAPADRYPTVSAFAEDVEHVLDGHTPAAEDAPAVVRWLRLYATPNRGLARLRVMDVDLWVLAGTLFGAGVALPFARSLGPWWWAFLGGALAAGIPPTLRALRILRSWK